MASSTKKRGRIGYLSQQDNPGVSACGRCRTSWADVESHVTYYESGSGMFPLCRECWAELIPEERLPFYRVLWEQWRFDAIQGGYPFNANWDDIERAVMQGPFCHRRSPAEASNRFSGCSIAGHVAVRPHLTPEQRQQLIASIKESYRGGVKQEPVLIPVPTDAVVLEALRNKSADPLESWREYAARRFRDEQERLLLEGMQPAAPPPDNPPSPQPFVPRLPLRSTPLHHGPARTPSPFLASGWWGMTSMQDNTVKTPSNPDGLIQTGSVACPDCRGTGQYVGLGIDAPQACSRCGGSGKF